MSSKLKPGRWFQCTIDQSNVRASDLPERRDDVQVTAYHATGVTHSLHIIPQGYVSASLGQSAHYQGIAYFFASDEIDNGAFHSAYTFLNDESSYLWSANVECVVNCNWKYGAGKKGSQLVQPPNTGTLTAAHFHCTTLRICCKKS